LVSEPAGACDAHHGKDIPPSSTEIGLDDSTSREFPQNSENFLLTVHKASPPRCRARILIGFPKNTFCTRRPKRRMARLTAYSFSYPHLFISPTFQQPVSMQASYRLWQTRCVPQCERACEQVARCWANASLEDIATNGTLSMAARTAPKPICHDFPLPANFSRPKESPSRRLRPPTGAPLIVTLVDWISVTFKNTAVFKSGHNEIQNRPLVSKTGQYPTPVPSCRIAHFGVILPFVARSLWAISEGCPRLRLERDRQRSTKGW
jgi:hypothetical protein